MAKRNTEQLTEAAARAALAAGRALPLAWLWLLGDSRDFHITVENPLQPGRTMNVSVRAREISEIEIRIDDGQGK